MYLKKGDKVTNRTLKHQKPHQINVSSVFILSPSRVTKGDKIRKRVTKCLLFCNLTPYNPICSTVSGDKIKAKGDKIKAKGDKITNVSKFWNCYLFPCCEQSKRREAAGVHRVVSLSVFRFVFFLCCFLCCFLCLCRLLCRFRCCFLCSCVVSSVVSCVCSCVVCCVCSCVGSYCSPSCGLFFLFSCCVACFCCVQNCQYIGPNRDKINP